MQWQHNANTSYKLASIPRYDDIVRMDGWTESAHAANRRATRGAPKTARRIYGKRARPAGRRQAAEGGVLNITEAVCTAGLQWWRSGTKKRTQNVSEYMLVLALCLVDRCSDDGLMLVACVCSCAGRSAQSVEQCMRRTRNGFLSQSSRYTSLVVWLFVYLKR